MKNISRREFIKASSLVTASVALFGNTTNLGAKVMNNIFISQRPASSERNFISEAVEKEIVRIKDEIDNPELSWLFENCFPNTLDTTVKFQIKDNKPDTFVITGDIESMWLRDSSAQVWPYLRLANTDKKLQQLLAGVINRQTKCILIDPYANAFNSAPGMKQWESDLTDMKPELHERKWEIDSLCYPIRLAHEYWKVTGDVSCFDTDWMKAMKLVVKTFKEQQRKEDRGPYKFMRETVVQTDTVAGWGWGNPVNPVGLICSIFRPSDDATIFPFLIPSNLFAVQSLKQLAEMSEKIIGDRTFAKECLELADEVEKAVFEHAVFEHKDYGKILAFEVDGFGNRLYMDDSNIPSLLSLPYLGCIDPESEIYKNTRRFILSQDNPYFFDGKFAKGIGGPHVGLDMIWPMSIIMQAMTSNSDDEIVECIKMLIATHADTGFMHESFHKDDPKNFTRAWFAWVNTLFGELIAKLSEEKKNLLKKL